MAPAPGAVDGKAGYRTQQAVIAFQAWNVPAPEAKGVYRFASIGTTVVVI